MNEKGNIEAKLLICKSGDLLLARRSQRLRRAGVKNGSLAFGNTAKRLSDIFKQEGLTQLVNDYVEKCK